MRQVSPRPLAGCAPLDAGVAGAPPLDRRLSVGAGDLKQARAQEGLSMLRRGSRDDLGLSDGRPAAAQQRALEQHADPGIGAGPVNPDGTPSSTGDAWDCLTGGPRPRSSAPLEALEPCKEAALRAGHMLGLAPSVPKPRSLSRPSPGPSPNRLYMYRAKHILGLAASVFR